MPTDNEPTQDSSTTGPGEERMRPGSIVVVALYLVFVSVGILYGLIKLWPYPTPSGEKAQVTSPSQSPAPTPTPTPTQASNTSTNQVSPSASQPPRQTGNRPSTAPASPTPTPTAAATLTATPTPTPSQSGNPQNASVKAPCVSSTPKAGTEKALPDPECIGFLGSDPVPIYLETRLLLLVMLSGALGSSMHSLRSLYWYTGNRMMVWSWVAFYLLLPLTGSLLAVIFYFVVRGGFFSPQSSFDQTSPFGFAALSALVGLFSPQATLKLKEIAETIFSKPSSGEDSKPQESASQAPSAKPAPTIAPPLTPASGAKDDSVRISGTGFSERVVVKFGDVAAVVSASSDTSITVVVPDNPSATGPVDVQVTNADGQSVTSSRAFTYVSNGSTNGATVDELDGHDEIKSNTTDEELPITEGGVE